MTDRQKAYLATLCRLCRELGRPVTVGEVAEVEGVVRTSAGKVLDELIYRGYVVWCRKGRRKYYWPKDWKMKGGVKSEQSS